MIASLAAGGKSIQVEKEQETEAQEDEDAPQGVAATMSNV
ncbi:hypothetical protein IWX88_000268 [Frigoribacterium sp. CG_9.8]|nr:hypothetical protein [Frigoribacterium sp. CG_9.8]